MECNFVPNAVQIRDNDNCVENKADHKSTTKHNTQLNNLTLDAYYTSAMSLQWTIGPLCSQQTHHLPTQKEHHKHAYS